MKHPEVEYEVWHHGQDGMSHLEGTHPDGREAIRLADEFKEKHPNDEVEVRISRSICTLK